MYWSCSFVHFWIPSVLSWANCEDATASCTSHVTLCFCIFDADTIWQVVDGQWSWGRLSKSKHKALDCTCHLFNSEQGKNKISIINNWALEIPYSVEVSTGTLNLASIHQDHGNGSKATLIRLTVSVATTVFMWSYKHLFFRVLLLAYCRPCFLTEHLRAYV